VVKRKNFILSTWCRYDDDGRSWDEEIETNISKFHIL